MQKIKFLPVLIFCLAGMGGEWRAAGWSPQVERSVWTAVPGTSAQQAFGARAFTVGNRAYAGTGQRNQTTFLSDFREYNPENQTWTLKASYGGGPIAYACAFSIGNKGYLGVGHNQTSIRRVFWEYDPAADRWTRRADFPGASRVRPLGLAAGGKGYVMMGIGEGDILFKDIWAYDPATDSWTVRTPCPGNARSGPVGFAIGTKLYVGLGEAQYEIDPTFWEYDTQSDTWAQKRTFPGALRWGAAAAALGAKGYVCTGGGAGDGYLSDMWEYDPATDTWTRQAVLPAAGRSGATAFGLGQELYAGLGQNESGLALWDVWRTCPHGFFGQTPPGTVPKAIAKTFLGNPDSTIYAGSMSPDGTEYLYTLRTGSSFTIMGTRLVQGTWTTPAPAAFSAGYGAIEPHITHDNQTVYFSWFTPAQTGIYAADRTAHGGWSAPRYAGPGMFVSSSRDGQLYITDFTGGPNASLAKVFLQNGRFDRFERLIGGMDAIRAQYPDQAHPCIAPDGSYLLFDVAGGSRLFVCFRNANGNWGPAIDLTQHGIDPRSGIATISRDGRYVFFGMIPGDYFWASTDFIERLGPGSNPVGDLSADGEVGCLDLLLLQLLLTGQLEPGVAPANNATGGDWNGDGWLNAMDALGLASRLCENPGL